MKLTRRDLFSAAASTTMLARVPAMADIGLTLLEVRMLALSAAPNARDWEEYKEHRVFADESDEVRAIETLQRHGLATLQPSTWPASGYVERQCFATEKGRAVLRDAGILEG